MYGLSMPVVHGDTRHAACLHSLFEARARRSPTATALIVGDEHISYHELNGRANRLAHELRARGVGPEVLVGVCAERTAAMIVGLLAILKAGGAYVPIDPAYPPDRIAYILRDARAPVLLTQAHLRGLIEDTGAACIDLDTIRDALPPDHDNDPVAVAAPSNLAYIIYTSGSTGRPKGVAITHANAVALLRWADELYGADDWAGVLAATSICFDLSVYELFGTLAAGGCVILAQNALALPSLPARERVTLINTVPSAMAYLVRAGAVPSSVRTVNLAGEPLKRALARQVYALPHVERLFNLYGPSEDTTYSTWLLVDRDDATEPTIGQPISATCGYVLSAALERVPDGQIGELYLGGAGLARGYLGRPALTAEKFMPDPWSATPGARLYRTGDLVRRRADGQLEYLGRSDHQVKIRGFRVELGEIESALSRDPRVREVVVVAHEDERGDRRLVAYLAADPASAPGAGELRRMLGQRLPEYMVPSAFMVLDALPLTPNGKIDRKALPAPEWDRHELDAPLVAPRSPLEGQLAAIWRSVLGIETLGVHDSLHELGGHSLLATQILARIAAQCGVTLTLAQLFARPTIAGLAEVILASQPDGVPDVPLLPGAGAADPRLSDTQIDFWFVDQMTPGSPMYTIALLFRATGSLDHDTLQRSLDALVERHSVLRTLIEERNGQPVPRVSAAQPVPLTWLDLRPLNGSAADAASSALAAAARQPFDLSRDQLLRALVLQHDERSFQLLLTTHHVAFDGWSTGLLLGELGAIYSALASGDTPPPLPSQLTYGDYASWQHRRLSGSYLERLQSYWHARLAGAPTVIDLPTDRPRPATQSFRGAKLSRCFPAQLLVRLEQFARREQASLFMTLLAGLAVLLARLSGHDDLVIGAPIANRTRHELEDMLGVFINTLALRIDLDGNPPFRELLARVRDTALAAYAHQDLPYVSLIKSLQIPRDLSHNPLVQVLLAVQNVPLSSIRLPDLAIDYLEELDTGTSKTDLTIFVEFPSDGPTLAAEYSTDLFDGATVDRLLDQYLTLLDAAVADPDRPVAELALLDDAARRRMLIDWNASALPLPVTTLHALVAAQAARTPDAVAIVCGDARLSYRELDRRADRMARYLRGLGVGPDRPVGVCLERTAELVVALLAILKAGGAYLPLDPGFPRDRLRFMLTDARAPVLLTDSRLLDGFADLPLRAVCLDRDAALIAAAPDAPGTAAGPDNLAYVIYTSGSTGRPKGVAVEHRAIVNFLGSMQLTPGLGADDLVVALTTLSFDIAGLEIWLPLISGARVALVSREVAADGYALAETLRALRPTLLQATPATWQMLLAAGWQGDPGLRALCGGEALGRDLADVLLRRVGALWNVYGPTETTVWSTIEAVVHDAGPTVTIGRPIANTQAYVLDRTLRPVPIGVVGELYLGGAGLARGYLGRPALTAETFVPNPFRDHQPPTAVHADASSVVGGPSSDRLYRTGDLARYLPDGRLEFLGRNDHQVKLRGFRIELGEIDAALQAQVAVAASVTVAREDKGGDRRLVAYLVARPGHALDPDMLRAALRTRLPEYMIPAAFVALDALPLTANGKVDRRALPAPERPFAVDRALVAPSTPFEEIVDEIWHEVLDVGTISVHDNFFEIGGHSLLATQILARVRDRFEIALPVRAMFEAPTVAGLAGRIEAALIAELEALDDDALPTGIDA